MHVLERLRKEYDTARAKAQDIHDTAKADDREKTDDERTAFDAAIEDAKSLKARIVVAEADIKAIGELEALVSTVDDGPSAKADGTPTRVTVKGERLTPGERLIKSDAYQSLRKAYPNGIPKEARVQMPAAHVADGLKALLMDPHLTPALHVVAPASLSVIDLFSAITIIDDSPESVKVFRAAFTNAADVVAEGVAKPESTLVWTPETLNLDTIAHHLPITNQTLNHNPLMRSFVDTFMVNGVRAKVSAEVAATLAAATGLQLQAFDTDLRTTLRKAVTKAQDGGAEIGAQVTGIAISSADAETLDLEQLANLVLSPGEAPAQASGIWRTPLVVCTELPEGFAYVGDLRQIHLFTRGGVNVSTGWVNTQFTENEQTLLAETEAASTVLVGPAIVKADLTAA